MSSISECVCVFRLANCYIAAHVNGNEKALISMHRETDKKIAQATARTFAERRGILYQNDLWEVDKPIISVIKNNQKWFPAELYGDNIVLLEFLGFLNLGSEREEAIKIANVIASIKKTDCIPSIGIFLDENRKSEKKG
jgi:hypothetical protein